MASNRVPPAGATSATTSSAGIVQLTDSTSSTSTTTAATPNAVKSAYDLANGAIAKTLTTTTGDIIYASSANTPARLGIGSTGQVLTVSGGAPAWATASAPTFSGVMLRNSSDHTNKPAATTFVLPFDLENWDTDNYHSNTVNNTRITIPSGKAGKYLIIGCCYIENQSVGNIVARVYKNGGNFQFWQQTKLSGQYVMAHISTVVDAAVGDYFELGVYTDSATSTFRTDYYTGFFSAQLLGA